MRVARALAAVLAVPFIAAATTLIPHTVQQRAEASDRVALVQVLSQRVEERPGEQFPLKTYTQVAIGSDFRGAGPSVVTIVQLGGTVGATSMEIPGDAKFRVGETAVVFLRCRLAPDRCHLVAMGAGKLDVMGEDAFVQDLTTKKWERKSLSALRAEVAGGVAR